MTGQYSVANAKSTRSVASGLLRNTRIGSFEVKKDPATDMWYLKVNHNLLIGTDFPSQKDALAVLHGLFTGMDASTAGMNAVIAQMVARGTGVIESDVTEVILDTYYINGNTWRWRSSNNWWNTLTGGIGNGYWTSTSSATGTYLKVDRGSRIQGDYIMFSADDPDQTIGGTTDPWVRLTVTPSTGGTPKTVKGVNTGAGDSRWYWLDDEGSVTTFSTAEIEAGGTFGWDQADSVKIEIGKG